MLDNRSTNWALFERMVGQRLYRGHFRGFQLKALIDFLM
jgi:hypothetical protein